MPRLRVDRVEGLTGWFVVPNDPPIGPYATRKEAVEAKIGVAEFFRNYLKPGWVTSENAKTNRIGLARTSAD